MSALSPYAFAEGFSMGPLKPDLQIASPLANTREGMTSESVVDGWCRLL